MSKQPASSIDPYVGCISVDSVPPPHTPASIMRCISKIEMVKVSGRSQLFTSISNELPMRKLKHISMLTSNHPGCTPVEPMAFVVEQELPAEEAAMHPYNPSRNQRSIGLVQRVESHNGLDLVLSDPWHGGVNAPRLVHWATHKREL